MERKQKITVTGDLFINVLKWQTKRKEYSRFSYAEFPAVYRRTYMGGALLLAQLISYAAEQEVNAPVVSKTCSLEEGALVSIAEVAPFSIHLERKAVYRIKKFLGFEMKEAKQPLTVAIQNDNEDASIVVLEDANNGFNQEEAVWPAALKNPEKSPLVLYKSNKLDFTNPLWKRIKDWYLDNAILIISGDDLRAKGVNISKGLSWEKTGLDFVWQMKNNPEIKEFMKCKHVIVPLGLEGAIYLNNEHRSESHLFFLTNAFEGEFIKEQSGFMYGLTSCFTAGLVRALALGDQNEGIRELIEEGIKEGIVAAQKYYMKGFGEQIETAVFPDADIFKEEQDDFILKSHIQQVQIKDKGNANCKGCWYILKEKSSSNLGEIAYNIVRYGEESALRYIPIARFGNLKTVDRTEIESYQSIKNLIDEYISSKHVVRPLSIAVFGKPGSGKSFGVTEVALSIAPGTIEKLDFNLSQFQSIQDLVAAFHKVRDIALSGKIPLVFFDEFDSTFGEKLGWLKYFLAPMQDGLFRDGDSVHPIGKAIFVFAGGTAVTYEAFCGEGIDELAVKMKFDKEFINAKGPDFISRLRGYVNILGINQTEKTSDPLFIIRRAMLLRSLLERKVPHLIGDNGEAFINNGVVRAMLNVPRYKHESRSMEAIVEMSMLNNAKRWEQSHLPSERQLKLHVDDEAFTHYLMLEGYFSEKVELLTKKAFDQLVRLYRIYQPEGMDEEVTWETLTNEQKKWFHDQIEYIPLLAQAIHYEVVSVNQKPAKVSFIESQIRTLMQTQHKYAVEWWRQEGASYGSNGIISWRKLEPAQMQVIREYVECIPDILASCNIKLERLHYMCHCEADGVIQ